MKINPKQCGFGTRAVHVGNDSSERPEDGTGSVTVPIYQTSTYEQPSLDTTPAYEYARVQNPTRAALERNVSALEGGASGHAFPSGMSAISTLMTVLSPGDEVVVSRDVYGGTRRLFDRVLARNGLFFHWVDTTLASAVAKLVAKRPNIRMIYVETPSNPMMEISDIAALAEIAHRHGALLVVDNTFLSPCLQRPLSLGADVVLHSTTKFMGGHSDALGGVLVASEDAHAASIAALSGIHEGDLGAHFAYLQKCAGAVAAPFEAFLTLRGLRTLEVRMARHEESGRRLASFLVERRGPLIRKIFYPGLESHPGHAVQRRQASGFGSMISFDLGTPQAARTFLESLRVFALAESLGGVESLASLPAQMTHASVEPVERERLGITDSLVRLSVGIETYDDLELDVCQALDKAAAADPSSLLVATERIAC
jgi:cystathionine beta-lyase/cystathionine gamma-synthase